MNVEIVWESCNRGHRVLIFSERKCVGPCTDDAISIFKNKINKFF